MASASWTDRVHSCCLELPEVLHKDILSKETKTKAHFVSSALVLIIIYFIMCFCGFTMISISNSVFRQLKK